MKSTGLIADKLEKDTIKLMKNAMRCFEKNKDILAVAAKYEDEFLRLWSTQDDIRFNFYPPFNNDAIDLALASSRGFLLGFMDWTEDAELDDEIIDEANQFTINFLTTMAYLVPRLAMSIEFLSKNYHDLKQQMKSNQQLKFIVDKLKVFVQLSKLIHVKRNLSC